MTITIPDEIVALSNISATDFRVEIAAYLYEKQRLSIGKAHKLAGISLIQFQKELSKRNIYLHLDTSDIDKELQNLNRI